jgi:hypothetical protein
MASKMYGQFLAKALNKEVDFDTDTIKVMLTTSSYSPNQDTHAYKSDVTSKTVTYDAATNVIILDAADTTWANSTITARYAVIYDDAGASDATKVLLGYVDLGSDQSSTNGAFALTWDATGIFRITVG